MKQAHIMLLILLAALATLWPARSLMAADLSETARARLAQVAQMRREGKSSDAIRILEDAAKELRQEPAAAAAVEYVLADVYRELKRDKEARSHYGRLAMAQVPGETDIPGIGKIDIQQRALEIEDRYNSGHWLYRIMRVLAGTLRDNQFTGRILFRHSGVLAILVLTIAIKLALTPLSSWSFRSLREMQRVQPLLQEMQKKYKDKPQELNRRIMEIYREHGVNPLMGCLPMLLQMPIIILLWKAIALYQFPLSHESFLWIKSLAMADMPLALIYAASLYASSKLTMMPTVDSNQAQQQRMMAIMMPVMFFFLFKSYPAGFILGWFFFNVLTTAQQWQMMRVHPVVGEAVGAALPAPASAPGDSGGSDGDARRRPERSGSGSQRNRSGGASARAIKRKKGTTASRRYR